ncbi:hypothetical protein Gasu2_47340 [Galdieria sulphuraria]|uniref:Uncharacterized protein n=1 Tax=Galdieria sulphuraria TaxID=130081 RepID=M2XNI8_GALSU|nr:uncharacterized protein Gasu_11270 [Galdieria sulphuraria]EME31752.1 hypothetical protein Gasu_11270 [Galdieria sulphuraria]GJD10552.1 hypothetical protein Gasu2_47340 [Galdieria sulphuraria]|eukprot:XP_005708272.1 hypothetical protein Gasu_11270 [Galdieria sulphuraria]
MNFTKVCTTNNQWLRRARYFWLARRSFSQTACTRSLEQSKSQNSSVSSSIKEEQDDEDPPFAFLSRRTLRLLKIIVTTGAGIACVFADYSEITEEHIFSGIQRKAKGLWREMWSIDSQKRLELEKKRRRDQDSSPAAEEASAETAPEC